MRPERTFPGKKVIAFFQYGPFIGYGKPLIPISTVIYMPKENMEKYYVIDDIKIFVASS